MIKSALFEKRDGMFFLLEIKNNESIYKGKFNTQSYEMQINGKNFEKELACKLFVMILLQLLHKRFLMRYLKFEYKTIL